MVIFLKFVCKIPWLNHLGTITRPCYIHNSVIMRCVIEGLYYIMSSILNKMIIAHLCKLASALAARL